MSATESTNTRRLTDAVKCWDAALVMGVIYTLIYGFMAIATYFVTVPPENQSAVENLISNMTLIQMTIVAYFFGASKSAENSQRLLVQSKERTDSVLRDVVTATATASNGNTKDVKADDVNVTASGDVNIDAKDSPR